MSLRLCFCSLCKGEVVLSSYRKKKQHVALYGLWNSELTAGPSSVNKSRADESDSDDSSRDQKSEKDESVVIIKEDMCVVDEDVGEDSDDHHSIKYAAYDDATSSPGVPFVMRGKYRDPWQIGFHDQFLLAVERQKHNNRKFW